MLVMPTRRADANLVSHGSSLCYDKHRLTSERGRYESLDVKNRFRRRRDPVADLRQLCFANIVRLGENQTYVTTTDENGVQKHVSFQLAFKPKGQKWGT